MTKFSKAAQDRNNHMRMPILNSVGRPLSVHYKAMRIPVLAELGRFPVSLKIGKSLRSERIL